MARGTGGWLGFGQGGELHRAMSQVLRALRAASCRSLADGQLWLLTFFMARKQKNQRCNSSDCTRRWKHSLIRCVYALGVLGAVAFEFM